MATIFTLRKPFEGDNERSILNGHALIIRDKDNRLTFFDAITREALWYSTSLRDKATDGNYVTLTTASGARYELVAEAECDLKAVIPEPINTQRGVKPISYGDGYSFTQYTFGEPLTEGQFRMFLIKNNRRLYPTKSDAAWWEDYYVVEPTKDPCVWGYRIVTRYTD